MGKNCVYGHKRATLTFVFISKPRANIYKIGRFIVEKHRLPLILGVRVLLGDRFHLKGYFFKFKKTEKEL